MGEGNAGYYVLTSFNCRGQVEMRVETTTIIEELQLAIMLSYSALNFAIAL